MSLTAIEHALMLGRLLPEGPAWATSDQSAGADDLHLLLSALAREPARVGADYDLILEELIPDNANTDLDAWERIVGVPVNPLTDAQRLARIRAILNGPDSPTLELLELFAQLMAGNPDVRMFNRVGPRSATGGAQCGDRLRAGPWEFAALCELMPNVLGVGPDEFESWTNVSTAAADGSPVTIAFTADMFPMPPIAWGFIETPLVGVVDGDIVYASVWLKTSDAESFGFGFLGRDGVVTGKIFQCESGRWHRLEYEAPIGFGSTTPFLRLTSATGTAFVSMSWAVAGVRDVALQNRILERFPLHTQCHFGVIGEYETLLSHDPSETDW